MILRQKGAERKLQVAFSPYLSTEKEAFFEIGEDGIVSIGGETGGKGAISSD
jgi:hypothetical protein